MTPSERAALVAQIAVELHKTDTPRPGDICNGDDTLIRVHRLCRMASAYVLAAEAVTAERHPARPEMCEECGGVEDEEDKAA